MTPAAEAGSQSRRTLVAAALGLAAGVLAGCSGAKPLRIQVRGSARAQRSDVAVLNSLLAVEQHGIAAYTAGIPLLSPDSSKVAQQFLDQELAHGLALSDLIKRAGAKPAPPPARYELGNPSTEAEVMALLRAVERSQLAAYVRMIPLLAPGKIRSAVVAIYANDAQHLAVLSARAGQPAVPAAFVTGA